MHIEFLVEEASAQIVLSEIVPKIIGDDITFEIRDFRGKSNLLKNLPNRMKGYSNLIKSQKDLRIVVLIDEDRQDCKELKQKLEDIAVACGLSTKTTANKFQVLNRIVVEEIEAWFFGDIEAIRSFYTKIPETLLNRKSYRIPDEIKGGTWEALGRVLSSAGYYTKGFLPKTEIARNISPFMNPEINISNSFGAFRDGLKLLILDAE